MSTFTLQGNLKIPDEGGKIGSDTTDDAITIDSSGNIGIGKSNPQSKLDIDGGATLIKLKNTVTPTTRCTIQFDTDTNNHWELGARGSNGQPNNSFYIYRTDPDGGNYAMTIDENRNVGIGTGPQYTPNGKLHIFETTGTAVSATEGTLILEHNNPGGESSILFKSKVNAGSDYGFIKYNDGGAENGLNSETSLLEIGVLNDSGNNNNDELKFSVPGGFMYMRADGNVGIGTSSPAAKLGIVGGSIRIDYGQNQDDFFAAYTQSTGEDGRFILRWSGSGDDFNVQLRMYNNIDKKENQAGFFENSGNEDSFTFTGQHRSLMNKNYTSDSKGLIVSSNGKFINMNNSLNPTINQTLPYCVLSDIDNDIRVYGVISDKEDSNDLRGTGAGFVKTIPKTNTNEERIFINSLGEGAIWVSDKNGPLINGNYITSTTIPGYGGKQTLEENRLMNYTVGKITCDCNFSLTKIVKQKLKTRTVTETLQRKVEEDVTESKEKTEINFDETLNRYVQTTVTEEVTTKQIVKDTYDLYDSEGNIIGTHEVEREESYNVTKTEIDYDENGDVQYEDDLDENGNQQMVYKYETRFLQEDGTLLVDEADYNTRLANGESVYIACFVGCTYHCG